LARTCAQIPRPMERQASAMNTAEVGRVKKINTDPC